jgi:diketogulonate reductase-like aldo/keto reductase
MASHTVFDLNDGNKMPRLGFGLWQVPDEQAPDVVHQAIRTGYRLIDTAAGYGNEEGVGEGISAAGVARTDLFVTTKLASQDHGYDEALKAFDKSLERLGLAYVDLYLIHWPRPWENRYVETWRAFQQIKQEGRAQSIGVSNFTQAHIQRLIDETGVVPAVNQIELHPRFQQKDMRQFHDQLGIVTQSWSPLGRGHLQDNEAITSLASKYGKSWAQIVIRWHLDSNLSVIPKSVTPERIRQNFDVSDFQLTPEDVARINELHLDEGRVGAHPEDIRP